MAFTTAYSRLHPGPEYSAGDYALFLCGSTVEESQPHIGRFTTHTIKVFYAFFGLACATLIWSYKGALTSTLSVQRNPPPLGILAISLMESN